MVQGAINELPEEAVKLLSHVGKTVVIATVDGNGWPNTAPIAWAIAKDKQTIRMAINASATTLQNIYGSDKVSLFISGDNIALGVKGRARLLKEPMDSVPFATAMVEVLVEAVDDKMAEPLGVTPTDMPTWEQRRRAVSDAAVEQELLS